MEVKKIAESLVNRAKDAMGSFEEEMSKEAVKRRAICSACEVLVDGWCSEERGGCGCYMNNKVFCMSCKCPLPEPKWIEFV